MSRTPPTIGGGGGGGDGEQAGRVLFQARAYRAYRAYGGSISPCLKYGGSRPVACDRCASLAAALLAEHSRVAVELLSPIEAS